MQRHHGNHRSVNPRDSLHPSAFPRQLSGNRLATPDPPQPRGTRAPGRLRPPAPDPQPQAARAGLRLCKRHRLRPARAPTIRTTQDAGPGGESQVRNSNPRTRDSPHGPARQPARRGARLREGRRLAPVRAQFPRTPSMQCSGTRVRARLSRRPQTRMPAPGQLLSIPRTSTPGHQLRETQSRPAHDPGWLSARLHSAAPSGSAPQTPGRFGSAWPATGQPRNNAASAGLPAARRRPRRTLAVCRGYPCPCRPPSVIQRRKSRLNGRGRYRRTLHRKHPPPFCAVAHRRQPVPPRPLQSRQLLSINSGTSTQTLRKHRERTEIPSVHAVSA